MINAITANNYSKLMNFSLKVLLLLGEIQMREGRGAKKQIFNVNLRTLGIRPIEAS